MKATFSLVFALILNHQVLFAQSNLSIGIIGGPTIAKFWNTPNRFVQPKWMPAFSVGSAVRVNIAKRFFFQTDISYERKGLNLGDLEWTDFNGNFISKATFHHQFDYVVLTPTVGFSTTGKTRFEGSVGIFSGYLVGNRFKFVSRSGNFTEPPFRSPSIDDFNRSDFGSTVRLGVGFDFGKKWSANVNAVANLGFSKPFKETALQPRDLNTDQTLSLGLQFGVFYKI